MPSSCYVARQPGIGQSTEQHPEDMDEEKKRPPANEAEGKQLLKDKPFDAAADVPGEQLRDPDQEAAAGIHRHRIRPQRRG
jgi:hypothetical protein